MIRKPVALLLLSAGLLIAPPVAARLFTDDGSIDPAIVRAALWAVSVLSVVLAASLLFLSDWLMRHWKQVILMGVSTMLPLAMVELLLQWNMKPGMSAAVPVSNLEFSYTPTHNHEGFRGPEFVQAKVEGKRRVVVLGDSFIYGTGVDDQHTIPALLQTELASRWEVLNLGLPGTEIDQYRETAERFKFLEPDVVVVGICLDNDIRVPRQDTTSKVLDLQLVRIASRLLERTGDCRYPWVKDYAVDPEIQAMACEAKINPYLLERAAIGDNETYYKKLTALFENEPGIRNGLLRIKSVWPSAQFSLVLFPSSFQVSTAYFAQLRKFGFVFDREQPVSHELQDAVQRWATSAHVDSTDMLPWLTQAETATGQRHYHPIDGHLNALGNEVVAKVLAGRIEQGTSTKTQ